MKTLLTFFLCLFLQQAHAVKTPAIINQSPVQVERYELDQENTLKLKVDFGSDLILNAQDKKVLREKAIHAVELVYTQFKTHPHFDQGQLNAKRIQQLKDLIPEIAVDQNIHWLLVEQTGAESSVEASALFHGFVVYFGDPLGYHALKKEFDHLTTPFKTYSIKAEAGGILTHKSGTQINIEANSLRYRDGSLVKGQVEILYREFRDQADIAFSGIPMTFSENDDHYNFSSVGMFELRGKQDGNPVVLSKPAKIDFQTTEGKAGVGFYQLNEETEQWKRNKEITPEWQLAQGAAIAEEDNRPRKFEFENNTFWTWWVGKDRRKVTMKVVDDGVLMTRPFADDTLMAGTTKEIFAADPDILNKAFTKHGKPMRRDVFLMDLEVENIEGGLWGESDKRTGSLLAAGFDAGHTYPSMVQGLLAEDFGVFNCDQIYRTKSPIRIISNFVDEQSGKRIPNKHVLCVIDLDYNGSFSFGPNNFTCSAKGNNALALYTKDKKVYLLSAEAFKQKKIQKSGAYTFAMKEMTDEVTNSDELRDWLGLESGN